MRYLLAKTKKENQCSIIHRFMYLKIMLQSSTLKDKKLNSNVNIYKLSHVPFDIVLFIRNYDGTVQNALTIG